MAYMQTWWERKKDKKNPAALCSIDMIARVCFFYSSFLDHDSLFICLSICCYFHHFSIKVFFFLLLLLSDVFGYMLFVYFNCDINCVCTQIVAFFLSCSIYLNLLSSWIEYEMLERIVWMCMAERLSIFPSFYLCRCVFKSFANAFKWWSWASRMKWK